MAQPQITDIFKSRKRGIAEIHPSKRRKTVQASVESPASQEVDQVVRENEVRSIASSKKKEIQLPDFDVPQTQPKTPVRSSSRLKSAKTPTTRSRSKRITATSTPKSKSCKQISEFFSPTKLNNNDPEKPSNAATTTTQKKGDSTKVPPVSPEDYFDSIKPNSKTAETISEIATAFCDDHGFNTTDTPPARAKTPTKSKSKTVSTKRSTKSTKRVDLLTAIDTSSDNPFNFEPYADQKGPEISPRRKVNLKRRQKEDRSCEPVTEKGTENKETVKCTTPTKIRKTPLKSPPLRTKTELMAATIAAGKNIPMSSPVRRKILMGDVPVTPERSMSLKFDSPSKDGFRTPVRHYGSPNLLSPEIQERLARIGKLSEKLKQFSTPQKSPNNGNTSLTSPRLSQPDIVYNSPASMDKSKSDSPFGSPGSPSLALPRKYRAMAEMFSSVDTVVSMYHKRSEICTFSKLKQGVQQMTRKQFEQNNIGQIKTVYPTAYHLRQEKGLPTYGGGKTSGYQLTVEADLSDPSKSGEKVTKAAHDPAAFTAAKLLDRNKVFNRGLVEVVKKHHKEFLSNLERPFLVPDARLTRWHPKFPLEEVPDIEPASIPQPPEQKNFTSAKDVLSHAKGKMNPRVEKALEKISNKSPLSSPNIKPSVSKAEESKKNIEKTKSSTDSPNKALKGVSMSLLERIRAKESKKLEEAMTRCPADEKRTEMLSRLPDMARILRSAFVTNKKPSMPWDDAVKRIKDSSKSGLGTGEAERHMKLLSEVAPNWISVVEIRQGKFIKIDRNKDMNTLNANLKKIYQESKI